MEFDFLRPLASGLLGGLVVYLLARAGKRPAAQRQGRRVLAYSRAFKVVAAIFVPGAAFVAYAAAHARQSQAGIAAVIAIAFILAAAFLVYQAFLVYFAYDDTHIYYRSPLAGDNVIPWSEVADVGYSGLVQSHYIRTNSFRRIWCSSMLVGYEELCAFLQSRLGAPNGEA